MLQTDSLQLSSAYPVTAGSIPPSHHGSYLVLDSTASGPEYYPEDMQNATSVGNASSLEHHNPQHVSSHGIVLATAAGGGILSNLFIMGTILQHRKLRGSMSNVLLCHLCAIALAHCVIHFPIYVCLTFSTAWHTSDVACALQGTVSTFLSAATLFNLTAISVDKYRTIASPLRYSTRLDKSRLAVTCTIIWIPSLMLCILPLAVGPGYSYEPAEGKCDIALIEKQSIIARWGVSFSTIFIMYYIPGMIIVCCYSRIFCIARSHRKRIISMLAMVMLSFQAPITRHETRAVPPSEQKASITIAVFLGTFFLFYIPYSLLALFEIIFGLQINFYLALVVHVFHQFAPCVNGVVYGSMNKSLRQTLTAYTRKLYSRHLLPQRWQAREIRVPTVEPGVGNEVARL